MPTMLSSDGRTRVNCASIAASVGCGGPPNGSTMASQPINAATVMALAATIAPMEMINRVKCLSAAIKIRAAFLPSEMRGTCRQHRGNGG